MIKMGRYSYEVAKTANLLLTDVDILEAHQIQ